MCGICGIRRFGDVPISPEQIKVLLIGNERRGLQATGVAFQQVDGSIQVYKDDEPANRFVLDNAFNEFLDEHLKEDTLTFLGHTRAATKGHPSINKNNHPMWDGKVAVVHNGVITNDDQLFHELKYNRAAETDSDIFRAIISEQGFSTRALNQLNRISGSAAIAAVSTEFPRKLFLARSGNPIVLATTDDYQQLVWSSEKQPIYDSMRPWERKPPGYYFRKSRADYYFTNFPNETCWLIGDKPKADDGSDWIDWHAAFKTAGYFRAANYAVHETYASRRGVKKIKLILCPNLECKDGKERTRIQITEDQEKTRLKGLECPVCKIDLERKD